MGLLAGEKRKNDETRRHIPWWLILLVVGFALGVLVTIGMTSSSSQSTVMYTSSGDDVFLTATYMVEQATNMAGGMFFEENNTQADGQVDSLYMTATAIIQGATATAEAGE